MNLPAPYYSADGITILCADCRPVLAAMDPREVALLLADPPYGINYRTPPSPSRPNGGRTLEGDAEPFDPAHLLRFPRAVLWGANHYADKLPPTANWIVWDKRGDMPSNDQSDCELAWGTLCGSVRMIRCPWNGAPSIAAENGTPTSLHPTQKPIALAKWIIARWTEPGDLVVDPYMGSGYVAVACKELGRRFIGIEIVEHYCAVTVRRLRQQVFGFEARVAAT